MTISRLATRLRQFVCHSLWFIRLGGRYRFKFVDVAGKPAVYYTMWYSKRAKRQFETKMKRALENCKFTPPLTESRQVTLHIRPGEFKTWSFMAHMPDDSVND